MSDAADQKPDLEVEGLVDVNTVSGYLGQGFQVLDKASESALVDLSKAEVKGSAALAMLISWERRARKRGIKLRIRNAPEHLVAMAQLSDVADIVPFDTNPDTSP